MGETQKMISVKRELLDTIRTIDRFRGGRGSLFIGHQKTGWIQEHRLFLRLRKEKLQRFILKFLKARGNI